MALVVDPSVREEVDALRANACVPQCLPGRMDGHLGRAEIVADWQLQVAVSLDFLPVREALGDSLIRALTTFRKPQPRGGYPHPAHCGLPNPM